MDRVADADAVCVNKAGEIFAKNVEEKYLGEEYFFSISNFLQNIYLWYQVVVGYGKVTILNELCMRVRIIIIIIIIIFIITVIIIIIITVIR